MVTCARRPLLLLKRLSHWVPLQTATLLYEMQRRGKGARFGVVSMCIGSGGWAHGSAGLGRLAKPAGARTTHGVCAKAACAGVGEGQLLRAIPNVKCMHFKSPMLAHQSQPGNICILSPRAAGMGAAAVFERGSEVDAPPRGAVSSQLAGLSRDAVVS